MTGHVRLTIRYTDAGDGRVTAQIAEIPAAISEGRTRAEAEDDSDSLTLTYAA